jgi:hypothetical protein
MVEKLRIGGIPVESLKIRKDEVLGETRSEGLVDL